MAEFRREHHALAERYERERDQYMIPVTLPDGREFRLSPGRHNEVQKAVVEQFAPRFVSGARLLYLGDTTRKDLFVDKTGLAELGIPTMTSCLTSCSTMPSGTGCFWSRRSPRTVP